MKLPFAVIGAILILAAGVMAVGNFETYRDFTWGDMFQTPAKLTSDATYAYVTVDLSAGQTLRVTVAPTEPVDSILLILMTHDQFTNKFLGTTGVGKSEVLVWAQPTAPGQQVNFEQKMPAAGEYTIVMVALVDNGAQPWANGVPFSFSMKVSEPLNLTLPAAVVAVLGVGVLAFGVISKPKQAAQATPLPPPPPA